MRALLARISILVAVVGFVAIPLVFSGYFNLYAAETALQEQDYLRAAEGFEKAARLMPWRSDLLIDAGLMRYAVKDFPAAIQLLERASKRTPLPDMAWEALGSSHHGVGNLTAAAEAWETGLSAYPDNSSYYSNLVGVYRAQGDNRSEKEMLERWIGRGGADDARAHYRLGQLLSISDPARAMQEFITAASLDGRYDPAVQSLRTALNLAMLETDESRRLVIIGRGLGLVDEWTQAAVAFQQAVDADQENAEAWAWLGEARQQLGDDGREALDRAISLEAANPIVLSLRGLYWTRQESFDQALAEYSEAAGIDPLNPAWKISIAETYVLMGDLQAALEAYLQATELAPNDPTYLRLLAAFCANHNMQVEDVGLAAAQLAINLAPNDPQTLDVLGWTYLVLERYDEAQYQFARAMQIDPQFAPAHLHAGMLALQLEELESARTYLLKARELDAWGAAGEQAESLLNQYFP